MVVSAIGDPLAPDNQWVYLTGLFIMEFPEAYFYHASEKYAALLHDLGYWINDVGAETTLQVGTCWIGCCKQPTLRLSAVNQAGCGTAHWFVDKKGWCVVGQAAQHVTAERSIALLARACQSTSNFSKSRHRPAAMALFVRL